MIEKMKNLDKKNMFIGIGIVVVIIVILVIVSNCLFSNGTGDSFNGVESKMVAATKKYANDKSEILPTNEYETVTINADVLIEKEYMKSFNKINKKYSDCSGEVNITKINDDYVYRAYLKCSDNYKMLKDSVTSQEIVTSGDGLYKYNDNLYVYRGEKVNNYLKIGENTWRIMDIDKDGNIKIIASFKTDNAIWDDRYNSETDDNSGVVDFNVSRIKDSLINMYNERLVVSDMYINNVHNNSWCIGSRTIDDKSKDNTSECQHISDELPFGLITVSEYIRASLDDGCASTKSKECMNYNYLSDYFGSWWTLNAKTNGKSRIYYVNSTVEEVNASSSKKVRLVVVLKNTALITSGTGTELDPFILG